MSDYRYFQRRHPEWPRLQRDAVGRFGRMRYTVANRADDSFHEGLVVKIDRVWRGMLSLRRGRDVISGVNPGAIDLLPSDYKPNEFDGLSCRAIKGDMGPRLLFQDENGETELIIYTAGKASKIEPPIVFDLAEEVRRRWNAHTSQLSQEGSAE